MLSITHIRKHYGQRPALDDVSMVLQAGQFCVLLGTNGAGKSTLLQLLSGLFVPDEGTITVDGLSLQRYPAQVLARIGVVFQQQAFDLDLSVRRNLQFHADLHGMSRAIGRQRMADGANRLGLANDLDRTVRELSGGNRRKVELIRALLHQPGLILMDEATVGLDPKSRHDLLRVVGEEVTQRSCCVLWATHWVEEAEQANRVLVLHRGQLIADGSPAEVTAALGHPTLEQGFIARTSQHHPIAGQP